MKKVTKNSIKFIKGFILGLFAFSGVFCVSSVSFDSDTISHTKSDNSTTTVKAALNNLYTIHNGGTAAAGDILTGKTAFSGGSLKSGSISKPTTATGNAYTGTAGYLNNGSSALTTSTSLTLSSYLSSNQYTFKIGSGEQVTFGAGYYQYPINISNLSTSNIDPYSLMQQPSSPEAGKNYGYTYKKTSTKSSSSGATRYKARVTCLICQRAGVTKYFDGDGGWSDETNSGQGGADSAARGKWLAHFVSSHAQ